MSESATRDVIFRLRAEPGQGAIKNIEKFGKDLENIQKKAYSFIDKRMQQSVSLQEKASEAASKKFEQGLKKEQKAKEQASQKAARSFAKSIDDAIKQRDKEAQAADKFRRAQEKETERIHQRHRERQRAIALENRKQREQEAKESERAQRAQEKEAERIHKRHRQRQKSIAAQNRKTRQQEAAEQIKSVQAVERDMAAATGRLSAGNMLLESGLTSAGESLVRMSTGLATIGLVSEKNNEKLLRGLVLLRGVNDTVAGGINLWVRTGKIVEGYRATLEAVKATQTAINAQQAITAARSTGTAGSGVAGSVAAGAAGGAAARLTALQRVAVSVGGALGTVKTAAVALAAPLAKLGTVVVGALSIVDMIASGQIKPREGSVREGMANKAGGMIAGAVGWGASFKSGKALQADVDLDPNSVAGQVAAAELARRKSEEMEDKRTDRQKAEDNRRFTVGNQLDSAADMSNAKLQPLLSAIEMARGQDKIGAIDAAQVEIGNQQSAIQSVKTFDDPELRAQQTQKIVELDERAVSLAKERQAEEIKILSTKKEQAKTAIESSREELANAKETLSKAKDRVKATKELLLSAEVRFAQMDSKDQRKLLDTSKKAQSGAQLSRKERDLLLQSGIGKSRDIAEKQAVEEAKRLGFRQVEGVDLRKKLKEDEETVSRQKEIVKRVENTIKVKEEYVVSLEENVDLLREMVSDEVRRAMKNRNQLASDEAASREAQRARALRNSLGAG